MSDPASDTLTHVLERFPALAGGVPRRFGAGLINETWLVDAGAVRHVLQRVNPIFPAAIHANLLAVTRRLTAAGLLTPRLLPTADGRPCLDLGADGVWRVLTWIDGVSQDRVGGTGQARAAGELVARFHAALQGLRHTFVGLRVGVHDTPRHLERLRAAVAANPGHRLHAAIAPLADAILAGAAGLPSLPSLPDLVGHGDLKFNNVLFAGPAAPASEQALCLIDLDTVGPVALAYELGDAWRSWCNRSGEDRTDATLDLEVLRAALDGYCTGRGRPLARDERRALLLGPEWVSLELAARFAADALVERYFGWDPARFAGRGEHNLHRARGQWSLHQAFVGSRAARAALLHFDAPGRARSGGRTMAAAGTTRGKKEE
ncbi:MAG: phosphotransferase [Deltaproteobacteria bacterium]|nr:phosphotransferase [Deltaproteobacteria bacterium]